MRNANFVVTENETVPQNIFNRFGIKIGDIFSFTEVINGSIILRKKTNTFKKFTNSLSISGTTSRNPPFRGIDPYFLVECLTNDSEHNTNINEFLTSLEEQSTKVFVTLFMLIKAENLLRNRYHIGKEKIIDLFNYLLETKDVAFDDEGTLEDALIIWSMEEKEFIDVLILVKNERCGAGPLAIL